jgi:hypothetical protein
MSESKMIEDMMKPEAYAPFFLDGSNWSSVKEYADANSVKGFGKIRKIKAGVKVGSPEYEKVLRGLKIEDRNTRLRRVYIDIYTKLVNEYPQLKKQLVITEYSTIVSDPLLADADIFIKALTDVRASITQKQSDKEILHDLISKITFKYELYRAEGNPDVTSDLVVDTVWRRTFPGESIPTNQDEKLTKLMNKLRGGDYAESMVRTYYNGKSHPAVAKLVSQEISKEEAEKLSFSYNVSEMRQERDTNLYLALDRWAEYNETDAQSMEPSERTKIADMLRMSYLSGSLDKVSMSILKPVYDLYDDYNNLIDAMGMYTPIYSLQRVKGGMYNINDSIFNPIKPLPVPLVIDGVSFQTIGQYVRANTYLDVYREYAITLNQRFENKDLYTLVDIVPLDEAEEVVYKNAVTRAEIVKFTNNASAADALMKYDGYLPKKLQEIKDRNNDDFAIFEAVDRFHGLDRAPAPPEGSNAEQTKKWVNEVKQFVQDAADEVRRVTRATIRGVNELSEIEDKKVNAWKMRVITEKLLLSPPDAPLDAVATFVPESVVVKMFENEFGENYEIEATPVIQEYIYKRLYWTNAVANKENVSILDYKPPSSCSCRTGYTERSEQCVACAFVHVLRCLQLIYPDEKLNPVRVFLAVSLLDPSKKTLRKIQDIPLASWNKELPLDMKKQLGSMFKQVANPATLKLIGLSIETLAQQREKTFIRRVMRYSSALGQAEAVVPVLNKVKARKYTAKKWVLGEPTRTFVKFFDEE